jgi:L-asparaginase
MIIQDKILILNIGGTFNKIYNQLNGSLEIKPNNLILEQIINKAKIDFVDIDGLIYKDSLDMDTYDRESLVKYIKHTDYNKIIIIHGTDTIDKTALFLDNNIKNKQIVLVGAMIPYSIDPIEAVANLMCGYGFLLNNMVNNIFISMHGIVKNYKHIIKDRKIGKFIQAN